MPRPFLFLEPVFLIATGVLMYWFVDDACHAVIPVDMTGRSA